MISVAAGVAILIAIAVEAPVSATSLNPARTLGPDIVAGIFPSWWIYLVGPALGALVAAVIFHRTRGSIPCGKLVHTDGYACHFRDCAYRQAAAEAARIDSRPDPVDP